MFKPHYGHCSHPDCKSPNGALIVVRKEFCQICNHNEKQLKKKVVGNKTGKYVYKKVATGEGDVFLDVLNRIPDTEITRCFVCKKRVTIVTHNNMAHVLSKKQFENFRLNPDNIVILCHSKIADKTAPKHLGNGCHHAWDMAPRSELKQYEMFDKLFELEEKLKQEYKSLSQICD